MAAVVVLQQAYVRWSKMLDKDALSGLALDLRDTERRIDSLYATLKAEKDKKKQILEEMDKIVDRAIEQARKGE